MDAPVPGRVLNFVSTEYDRDNAMISGDDEVDDDDDDDDDKDFDAEAEMGTDDAHGPAHQAFQGEHLYVMLRNA